jgi:hypothetical protein
MGEIMEVGLLRLRKYNLNFKTTFCTLINAFLYGFMLNKN